MKREHLDGHHASLSPPDGQQKKQRPLQEQQEERPKQEGTESKQQRKPEARGRKELGDRQGLLCLGFLLSFMLKKPQNQIFQRNTCKGPGFGKFPDIRKHVQPPRIMGRLQEGQRNKLQRLSGERMEERPRQEGNRQEAAEKDREGGEQGQERTKDFCALVVYSSSCC